MSTMLPLAELTALRAEQEKALPDTALIRRITRTSDGAGGATESETTVATVACRLGPVGSGNEQAIAERLGAVESATVTLPYGTDVRLTDRLAIGGATWEVGALLTRSWATAVRVIVTKVR